MVVIDIYMLWLEAEPSQNKRKNWKTEKQEIKRRKIVYNFYL